MDLLCPKCGELWDNDSIHEEAKADGETYRTLLPRFQREGCAIFGTRHNAVQLRGADEARALYELLGDDADGAAAMLEDYGLT